MLYIKSGMSYRMTILYREALAAYALHCNDTTRDIIILYIYIITASCYSLFSFILYLNLSFSVAVSEPR